MRIRVISSLLLVVMTMMFDIRGLRTAYFHISLLFKPSWPVGLKRSRLARPSLTSSSCIGLQTLDELHQLVALKVVKW